MIDFYYETAGKNEDMVTVVLSGNLDADNCEYLLTCVENQIKSGYQKLILDCGQLTYISSMGLGMLVRVNSRMKKVGGEVKLAALNTTVSKIVSLVGLDRVFHLYPTVEDAIAAHGG